MNDVILQSKLFSPVSPAKDITRQRLIEQLGTARLFTSIVAPAGYGKTNLIAQWENQVAEDIHIRRLSLDIGDNNSQQFLTYFVAALCSTNDVFSAHIDDNSSLALISNTLIRFADKPIVLVLDNYHVIGQDEIHAIINFFVTNPIPQLRFIVLSRTGLPLKLAHLRIQQKLTEITARHLSFTQDEIVRYFQVYHTLDLIASHLTAIEEKTRGWVASIQILSLRLQEKSNDIDSTLEHFSGEDRYLADYFSSEFLEDYPAELQRFLIESSIFEDLRSDLCDAVLEQEGSREQFIALEDSGIPIFPLDTTQSCYQYHPLFADFLRSKLESKRKLQLHQRASDWYCSRDNLTDENIKKALYHATVAGQEKILSVLNRLSSTILRLGHEHLILDSLKSIPYEALFDYPRLLISYLWALFASGQSHKTLALLEQAESVLPDRFTGEVYVLRAQLSSIEGNPQKSRQLAQQALRMLPPDDMVLQGLMQFSLVRLSFFYEGQTNQAIKQLTEAIILFEQNKHYAVWSIAVDLLIAIRHRHGSLLEAEALCRYGIATCEAINRPDFMGAFYSQSGKILYERNCLDEAESILRQGRILSREHQGKNSFLASSLTLSRIVNQQEADAIIEEARQFLQADAYQIARINAFPVSHLCEHGWIAPWIDWNQNDYHHNAISMSSIYTYLDLARRLCISTEANPRRAISLLLDLEQFTSKINQRSSLLEVLILLAYCYSSLGDKSSAILSLQRALLIARYTGHCRLFLDLGQPILDLLEDIVQAGHHAEYARELLEHQDNPSTYAMPVELSNPLTPREIDILRLLTDGYSNPEMSRYFELSVSTVRWHVKNIYRKLDVNNRTRATVRARDLGLI